jgi:hypothetical protein
MSAGFVCAHGLNRHAPSFSFPSGPSGDRHLEGDKTMLKHIAIPALILASAASVTAAVRPMLYEEQLARQEEALIVPSPIGGIKNRFWYDYRTNVNETQKELATDLRHVSDTEDLRDAWDEYRHELKHARVHYVEEMAERGYRYGIVRVGD